MTPWPRKIVNFPIILLAVMVQFAMSVALFVDPSAHFATQVHILYLIVPPSVLPFVLLGASIMAVVAFSLPKKIHTLLFLTPQQLLLWMSAGGSFQAMWLGHYADGVERSHAHLFADQSPIVLIAVFHSWAIMLLLMYGED